MDALYRFLPDGISKNDNAAIAQIYNNLDQIAAFLNCSIVCVHHASKGDQSGKGVTDVGSGAGSQSRAVDTHIVIRPHELADCAVMDAAVRSFPPVMRQTIQFAFPLWSDKSASAPTVLEPKSRGERGVTNYILLDVTPNKLTLALDEIRVELPQKRVPSLSSLSPTRKLLRMKKRSSKAQCFTGLRFAGGTRQCSSSSSAHSRCSGLQFTAGYFGTFDFE